MHVQGDDKDMGLYTKFKVARTDGSSKPGKKHDGCRYFVLDVNHDPYAAAALRMYASACGREYPELAKDLYKLASESEELTGGLDASS